jgi:hypothetical protein
MFCFLRVFSYFFFLFGDYFKVRRLRGLGIIDRSTIKFRKTKLLRLLYLKERE